MLGRMWVLLSGQVALFEVLMMDSMDGLGKLAGRRMVFSAADEGGVRP